MGQVEPAPLSRCAPAHPSSLPSLSSSRRRTRSSSLKVRALTALQLWDVKLTPAMQAYRRMTLAPRSS